MSEAPYQINLSSSYYLCLCLLGIRIRSCIIMHSFYSNYIREKEKKEKKEKKKTSQLFVITLALDLSEVVGYEVRSQLSNLIPIL